MSTALLSSTLTWAKSMTAHCWLLWALEDAEGGVPLTLALIPLLTLWAEEWTGAEAGVPWRELRSSGTMSRGEPPPPPIVAAAPMVSKALLEEVILGTGVVWM